MRNPSSGSKTKKTTPRLHGKREGIGGESQEKLGYNFVTNKLGICKVKQPVKANRRTKKSVRVKETDNSPIGQLRIDEMIANQKLINTAAKPKPEHCEVDLPFESLPEENRDIFTD